MKPAPFSFARPTSLEVATSLLAEHPDAKVLAGGQSLVPLLSMRLAAPSMLIDINALAGLDQIEVDATGVRIGALVRHSELLADDDAAQVQPLLRMALRQVAHPTIRNRGTTLGSLVHADAAAEMPMVLRLLGGSLDVVSVRGRRTIAADDLYVGVLESSLAADELAVSAWFPALEAGAGVAFEEVARRHGDYAICGVAALVRPGRPARVGLISVTEVPTVVEVRPGSDPVAAVLEAVEPVGDIHASAAYRTQLLRVLTERVVARAGAAGALSGGRHR